MTYYETFMAGYRLDVLRTGQRFIVDMVIPTVAGPGAMILTFPWWTGDFQPGSGIYIVSERLVLGVSGPHLGDASEYRLTLLEPQDDGYAEYKFWRNDADYNRGSYIKGLKRLMENERRYRVAEYLRYTLTRPRPDLEAEERERSSGLREIGGVVLLDEAGIKIDSLVVDERGNAAVYDEDGWLAPYMTQWQEGSPAGVAEFVKWVSERTPYGVSTFGTPVVGSRKGSVEDIAVELVRG